MVYVYQLLDPWEDGCPPFYIGISINPWERFYAHCHDRFSAAYPLLQCFLRWDVPKTEILKIYQECATRRQALDLEYELVTTTPGLLNRPYRKGRAY